jgi:hypothetical protein
MGKEFCFWRKSGSLSLPGTALVVGLSSTTGLVSTMTSFFSSTTTLTGSSFLGKGFGVGFN